MEIVRFQPLELLQPGDVCATPVRTPHGQLIPEGTILTSSHIRDLRGLPGIQIRRTLSETDLAQAMPSALRAFAGHDVLSPLGQTMLHLRVQAEAERCACGLPPLAPPRDPVAATAPRPSLAPPLDLGAFDPPELPALAHQLLQALAEDRLDAQGVASIISQSPGLTSRLLRLVNAPAFGMPRTVDRIDRAVALVGTREITLLASGLLLIETFGMIPGSVVDLRAFLAHSFAVATACRQLARHAHGELAETAFTAGLLHDLGRLFFLSVLPERTKACMEFCHTAGRPIREEERTFFGADHASLGSKLLDLWNLPDTLVRAVAGHHEPKDFLAAVVHLADGIVHAAALGANGDWIPPRLRPHALELSHTSLPQLTAAVQVARVGTAALLAALTTP